MIDDKRLVCCRASKTSHPRGIPKSRCNALLVMPSMKLVLHDDNFFRRQQTFPDPSLRENSAARRAFASHRFAQLRSGSARQRDGISPREEQGRNSTTSHAGGRTITVLRCSNLRGSIDALGPTLLSAAASQAGHDPGLFGGAPDMNLFAIGRALPDPCRLLSAGTARIVVVGSPIRGCRAPRQGPRNCMRSGPSSASQSD